MLPVLILLKNALLEASCMYFVKTDQTKHTIKIFRNINCKSKYEIYLLECDLCNIPCIGKSNTTFNVRLNNHRNDIERPKCFLPVNKHFFRSLF